MNVQSSMSFISYILAIISFTKGNLIASIGGLFLTSRSFSLPRTLFWRKRYRMKTN
ncbi:hypothetical protein HP456_00685 [Bacillus haikouensis]|uniref:hypothetical protein n=1 Tax=Bacillus haikouensis TaxID=1510468 RepID=UPI001551DF25|nr:hypothetical protein [Bacillus haikouensis]NQD64437.1 hypothetical protein [Bacillus haikouensis]